MAEVFQSSVNFAAFALVASFAAVQPVAGAKKGEHRPGVGYNLLRLVLVGDFVELVDVVVLRFVGPNVGLDDGQPLGNREA